jgi:hypothetical protein
MSFTGLPVENVPVVKDSTERLALHPADGAIVVQLSDHNVYVYNSGTNTWTVLSTGGGGTLTGVANTNSINLTNTGGIVTADLKLSAAGAVAGNTLVAEDIQTDGLRGQVPFATNLVSGTVSTIAQSFGGDKTFINHIKKQNDATNASYVEGLVPAIGFASVNDGQSSTVIFGGSNSIKFIVSLSGGQSIECHASFLSNVISAISDPGNIFLLSDSGTGIYITKSSSSATLTVKSRMGLTLNIGLIALSGSLTTTGWV